MNAKPKVYVRADGGSQMGIGHIIRSLALVDMLAAHFECIFISRPVNNQLKEKIEQFCPKHIVLDDEKP